MFENKMRYSQSLRFFERELQQEEKSLNTILSYEHDLIYLENWLKQRKQQEIIYAEDITAVDLRDENY